MPLVLPDFTISFLFQRTLVTPRHQFGDGGDHSDNGVCRVCLTNQLCGIRENDAHLPNPDPRL